MSEVYPYQGEFMDLKRIVVVFLASCLTTPAAIPSLAQDTVRWASSFEQAKRDAAQQNKHVLVHFWSQSCPPCRNLERYVFTNPGVGRTIDNGFVAVKVNTREEPQLARQFDVKRIPTDVFITSDGKELHRVTPSPGTVASYIKLVNRVATNAPAMAKNPKQQLAQAYREHAAANPNEYDARTSNYQHSGVGFDNRVAQYNGSPATNEPYGSGQYYQNYQNRPPAGPDYRDPRDQSRNNNTNQNVSGGGSNNQFQSNPSPNQPQVIENRQYNNSSENRSGDHGNGGRFQYPPQNSPSGGGSFQQPHEQNSSEPATNPHAQRSPLFTAPNGQPNRPPPTGPGPANPRSNFTYNPSSVPPSGPSFNTPPSGPPRSPQEPSGPNGGPPLGMDGYCPVNLLKTLDPNHAWVKGDPRWGAIHRGRTYLFATRQNQEEFLRNPDVYSPALSCYDAVLFVNHNRLVPGRRQHGVAYRKQIFLFSDEETLKEFWSKPDMYAGQVHQAMKRNALGRRYR